MPGAMTDLTPHSSELWVPFRPSEVPSDKGEPLKLKQRPRQAPILSTKPPFLSTKTEAEQWQRKPSIWRCATRPTPSASSPRVPEVDIVKVSVRNRDKSPGRSHLNDVICGQVQFRAGSSQDTGGVGSIRSRT